MAGGFIYSSKEPSHLRTGESAALDLAVAVALGDSDRANLGQQVLKSRADVVEPLDTKVAIRKVDRAGGLLACWVGGEEDFSTFDCAFHGEGSLLACQLRDAHAP